MTPRTWTGVDVGGRRKGVYFSWAEGAAVLGLANLHDPTEVARRLRVDPARTGALPLGRRGEGSHGGRYGVVRSDRRAIEIDSAGVRVDTAPRQQG